MELNPYKELDFKDQEGLNQLNLNHDTTIQNDISLTLGNTKETEMPKIKQEVEPGLESKPHLISKQRSKNKTKKGQWLVKVLKLVKCEICSKHLENGKYLQNHRRNCFSQANNDQLKQNEEN